MNSLIWWGLFFGLCLFLELSSPGYFFFLSFSLGAIAAAVGAWFQVTSAVQWSIFLGVSALSFFVLHRYAQRVAQQGTVKTNVDALHGKSGVVLAKITPVERGWIKIDGEIWAALPVDESAIEKDAQVKVVSSAGSHLIVKKIDSPLS